VQSGSTRWELSAIREQLQQQGWTLLRGFDTDLVSFSDLIHSLSERLTFDPARESVSEAAQKVDAGCEPVGLHIENGNTPIPPETVAFYSALSASHGAQTTVCDGHAVYQALPSRLRERLEQPYTMTRYLPEVVWRTYIAQNLQFDDAGDVTVAHLQRFIDSIPGQQYSLREDQGIDYTLTLNAIRSDNRANTPAFANALLGPSYNYETPVYRFADGEEFNAELLEELSSLCEQHIEEVQWQDGDIVIIDNKRCMHGRRAIPVDLSQRKLYIAMGVGAA